MSLLGDESYTTQQAKSAVVAAATPSSSSAECPAAPDGITIGELEDASPGRKWDFWYPSWEAWRFQRTLSYWISVMFLEGSIMFIVGAVFAVTGLGGHGFAAQRALVDTPYFTGGVCFTIGSYLGVLEVVNAHRADRMDTFCIPCSASRWRRLSRVSRWEAVAGYGAYTIGALFYNLNAIAGFWHLPFAEDVAFVGVPAALGAACFVFGAALECRVNKVWRCRATTCAWWLCICNLLGSAGFLVGGLSTLCRVPPRLSPILVDFMYLIGSAAFMAGALCTMWLWKCEQYGLGFLPEMNIGTRVREPHEAVLNMHAEYGCGRASAWQLPFLTMYLVNATASVILVAHAVFQDNEAGDQKYKIFESCINFAVSHGVMLLGSVVHHIPTAKPHSWLLVYMRVVLFLYTVNSWLTVGREVVA